jgi:hypothetical protein
LTHRRWNSAAYLIDRAQNQKRAVLRGIGIGETRGEDGLGNGVASEQTVGEELLGPLRQCQCGMVEVSGHKPAHRVCCGD